MRTYNTLLSFLTLNLLVNESSKNENTKDSDKKDDTKDETINEEMSTDVDDTEEVPTDAPEPVTQIVSEEGD